MTTTTSRALPRVNAAAPDARGHKEALLALPGVHPVEWTGEHPDAHLSAVASPQPGDWVPEDTVLDDPDLMLLLTQEEIIDGVPHLKVVLKPRAASSAFADDDADVLDDEDDDPYEFARLAAERQARETRTAKRQKIVRYSSLGALVTATAGLVFYLSPVGQDLLTNTETVTVEIEKEKTYTGELLD